MYILHDKYRKDLVDHDSKYILRSEGRLYIPGYSADDHTEGLVN